LLSEPSPDALLVDLVSEVIIADRPQRPPRLGGRGRLERQLLDLLDAFRLRRGVASSK